MTYSRYISEIIKEFTFSSHKMTFITGPRQAGKTTLSKHLLKQRKVGAYWNWDETRFRKIWVKSPQQLTDSFVSSGNTPLLILDEIHKAKLWKRTLKGLYDTLPFPIDIIVTGSARLDIYQKGSDSLLGRYFPFRLHPFSVREMLGLFPNQVAQFESMLNAREFPENKLTTTYLEDLFNFGNFPEPLFAQSHRKATLWRKLRKTQLVREDLRDLSRLPELSQIELLISLLEERAARQLSYSSLREDLEVAHTTVTRWMNYLKALYYCYEIKPYSKRIKNSLKREPKLYLWDHSESENEGQRFENLVANHLLKVCHFWTDSGEGEFNLHYVRDKSQNELDFLITKNKQPWIPIEAKVSDINLSPAWNKFLPVLNCKVGFQLVKIPGVYRIHQIDKCKIIVISADRFLWHLA